MPRCCPGRTVIIAGEGIDVTGIGSGDKPYRITLEGEVSGGGSGSEQPGDIKWTARASAPVGWLVADGSSVSRTQYALLFAAIGTVYGQGDGVSTFNLPDFTGRFVMGQDNAHPRGSVGGSPEQQLEIRHIPQHSHSIDHNHTAFTTATAGGHNHPATTTTQAGAHTHVLHFSNAVGGSMTHIPKGEATGPDSSRNAMDADGGHTHNVNIDPVAGHEHSANVPPYAGDSGNAGRLNPDPVPTVPPYATALPLIKT